MKRKVAIYARVSTGHEAQLSALEKQYESIEPLEVRIEKAKEKIKRLLDINYNGVDEKIIEEFVDKIIVHKDYFEWKFNFMNETIKLEISGKSKADVLLKEIWFLYKYRMNNDKNML